VFCNPASPESPAKLRLLYECAPLSFVIEAAGGASFCGRGSVLDLPIRDTGAKTTIAVGTKEDVGKCLEAMSASPAP
jgi:fructose-1,6-bisphosphatase